VLKDTIKNPGTRQFKPNIDLMPSDPGYYHEIEKAPPTMQQV